jgi:AAA15 family ATPase/GTPase
MLISFSVQNFRSIRDRQTLSMERAGDGSISRVAIDGPAAGGQVCPVAVIFGANASGKSTVIEAISYALWCIKDSAGFGVGKEFPTQPFLLDEESKTKSFAVEFVFSIGESEYTYSFSVRRGKVESESLKATTQGPVRRATKVLFKRTTGDDGRVKISANGLPGRKASIISATRPNVLFLSRAAYDNFDPLLDIYNWFVPAEIPFGDTSLGFVNFMESQADRGVKLFESDPEYKTWIVRLLQQADLGISDARIKIPFEKDQFELEETESQLLGIRRPEDLERLRRSFRQPALLHESDCTEPTELAWGSESAGTKAVWQYASQIYPALQSGRCALIDELQGLHPLLIRSIIEIFQSEVTNPKNAQLIFTSHNPTLLGNWAGTGYMLDRDQIWLTEKDVSGATELFPMTDFHPGKDDNLERLYLQGRFGAVPTVGSLVKGSEGEF